VKLGVLFCGYNTEETILKSLTPWLDLQPKLNITIVAVSVPFKEYESMGIPQDKTTEILINSLGSERVITQPHYILEAEARNLALSKLKDLDCDYIVTVDSDEIYDVDEIIKAIRFIENDEFVFSFSVWFKNYVFEKNTYFNQIFPNRFFKTKSLLKFYHDCDVLYSVNGKEIPYQYLPSRTIPTKVLNVKHLTWLNNDKSRRKYEYQLKHFGHCSYKWNYEMNRLEFDKEYYSKHRIPIPTLLVDSI
jgi:hypothetical protein